MYEPQLSDFGRATQLIGHAARLLYFYFLCSTISLSFCLLTVVGKDPDIDSQLTVLYCLLYIYMCYVYLFPFFCRVMAYKLHI